MDKARFNLASAIFQHYIIIDTKYRAGSVTKRYELITFWLGKHSFIYILKYIYI